MRKTQPRPPEVVDSIKIAQIIWCWAVRVHRSVIGSRPLVFYGAFGGVRAPLSAAMKRIGWIVVGRDVLRGPLEDLADPGVLAQEIELI